MSKLCGLERGHWLALLVLSVALACVSCSNRKSPPPELKQGGGERTTYSVEPVRGERGPLRLHMDGDEYECSACHDGFMGMPPDKALQEQHSNITFEHGLNLFCTNCHNPGNADTYVYYDGTEIPGDEPTRLCAKCHGPHFREWSLQVHGRVNGAWDASLGAQEMLDCIQCHDPHRPKFEPMKPEAPPVMTRFDRDSQGGHSNGA